MRPIHMHLRLQRPAGESGAPRASWLLLEDGIQQGRLRHGALADAATDALHARLTVYIPAGEVLLTRVSLPAGRRSQLLDALPYALEDDLIEDVDQLHCALGPKLASGEFVAAVIRKSRLESWLALLQAAGIQPRWMLPDALLLPWQPGHWSLACETDSAFLRTDHSLAWACDPAMLPTLLDRQLANGAPPGPIDVYGCVDPELPAVFARHGVETVPHAPSQAVELPALAMQSGLPGSELNLLQGSYAPRSRTRQRLRPWYATVALAASLLLLVLAGRTYEYYRLQDQNRQLAQRIEQVFRQAFPEVKRIVNPRAQMRHRLARLAGKTGAADTGFVELLARIAPPMSQTRGLQLQTLRYQSGRLDVQLEVKDLQTLEELRNRLAATGNLKVELKSANASDNKVQGRLLIGRKSG
jgi:general secretion pathway protein L